MTSTGYAISSIAALTRPLDGLAPIRQELGVRSFGINAWTAAAVGDELVPEHDEADVGHEEIYVVTAGRATFTVAGEEVDAPAGAIVFVSDPGITRTAVAAAAPTTVLCVGGKPGAVYEPLGWEIGREIVALLQAGDDAAAKARILEGLVDYPGNGYLLYNLACAEAKLGEREAALDHLEDALADQPQMKDWAAEDDDLATLRDDLRFKAAVAAAPGY